MPVPTFMHLGVVEQNYATPQSRKSGAARKPVSTGDVAHWLEEKYHIMETFAKKYAFQNLKELELNFERQIGNVRAGKPPTLDPNQLYAPAMAKIEARFRTFLTMEEMNGLAGIPTKAAMAGKSSRFKSGKARVRKGKAGQTLGIGRPSFVDTGLYRRSFKAWMDNKP